MSVNAALFEREHEPDFFARKCKCGKRQSDRCDCDETPSPRASRAIGLGNPEQPPEIVDVPDEDVDFDSDLTDKEIL